MASQLNSHKRRRGEEDDRGGGSKRQLKRWKPNLLIDEEFLKRLMTMLMAMVGRLIREILPEVLQRLAQPIPRVPDNAENNFQYQLRFTDNIAKVIYTNTEVTTEDGKPVKIAIIDTNMINSRQSDATFIPSISGSVDVLVLHGDVENADPESWVKNSGHERNRDLVCERKGKAPLLKGKDIVNLVNGVGVLQISFTDNSKFARNQKFRIGIRHKPTRNTQLRVRSAVSEPFQVKELRGRIKRNSPPSLSDEVWHLEKINKGKDLYERLVEAQIITVQQFLQQLAIDPEKLRKILGNGKLKTCGVNDKTWSAIVESAQTCDPGNEVFYYTVGGDQGAVLFFNSIYKLLGANFNGRYYTIDNLNKFEEAKVKSWKEKAFANTLEFKLMDGTLPLELQINGTSVQTSSSAGQNASHVMCWENLTEAQYNNYCSNHQPILETNIAETELLCEPNITMDSIRNEEIYALTHSSSDGNYEAFGNSLLHLNADVTSFQESCPFDSLDEATGEEQHCELSAIFRQQKPCSNMREIHTVQKFSPDKDMHNSTPLLVGISFPLENVTGVCYGPSSSQPSQHIDALTDNDSPSRLDLLVFSDDDVEQTGDLYQQCPEQSTSTPLIHAFLNCKKNWIKLKISLQVVAFFRAAQKLGT